MREPLRIAAVVAALLMLGVNDAGAGGDISDRRAELSARLVAAYPEDISGIVGNDVVFKDGTRLPFDDGAVEKSFEAWLSAPDIEDMFRFPYSANASAPPDTDPGRARNTAFFTKIYGDCKSGGVAKQLVRAAWPTPHSKTTIEVTTRNGVADKLRAVAADLANLPGNFSADLTPPGGGYVCRDIAGTASPSAHGYGIAIDIALKHADYWRWSQASGGAPAAYRNRIPAEIVAIFEKHGFIWGGRWRHFDTMHFEYRPEMFER